jgi:hypothetical protein
MCALSIVRDGDMPLLNINTLIEYRQYRLLKEESARSSVSMAELIRRAIDREYRPHVRPRIAGLELNIGIWRRPDAAVVGRLRERFFR